MLAVASLLDSSAFMPIQSHSDLSVHSSDGSPRSQGQSGPE